MFALANSQIGLQHFQIQTKCWMVEENCNDSSLGQINLRIVETKPKYLLIIKLKTFNKHILSILLLPDTNPSSYLSEELH